MGLAASTTFAAETMPALTLSHLQQQHGVAIDTRLSAYYNGWPQRANGPEGHEPQALNLSARWLGAMSDEQLRGWAKQHQLQADTPLALYGSPEDNASVAARLKQAGFTRLNTLSDALSQGDRLQKLPHFHIPDNIFCFRPEVCRFLLSPLPQAWKAFESLHINNLHRQ